MNKQRKSYPWQIYEKLLLCLASGICWGLVFWVGMILAWNGFSYPEQEINPFYPRLILGAVILFFLTLPYFYPGLFILPGWAMNLVIFYFLFSSEIDFIFARLDINSIYYAPETSWNYYVSSYDLFIMVATLIFLIILLRPALFYARFVTREIFLGGNRSHN